MDKHRTIGTTARRALLAGAAGLAAWAADAASGASVPLSSLPLRHPFVSHAVQGKHVTLKTRFSTYDFEGNTRKLVYNNVLIWLNEPVFRKWPSGWMLQPGDLEYTLYPLLNPSRFLRTQGRRVIVLDPGHGGADRGASNGRLGLDEKTVTLDLARRVQTLLQKYRLDVRLTRSSDRTLSLEDRCRTANRSGADLFVSIHLNSAENRSSCGLETHVLPPSGYPITASASVSARDRTVYPGNRHNGANLLLGHALQKHLLKHTRAEDRGVRRSRFFVIRNVACPSALVECGFLSNSAECSRLSQAGYRETLVKGLAEGLLAYLNDVRRCQQPPGR